MRFPKYKQGEYPAYYVSAGSMIIDLKSNTYVADITGYAEYGYTAFSVSPTISIDGNLGITFSNGIDVLDSHRCYK